MPASCLLLADKAYDGDDLRQWLVERGTTPVIPNLKNRPTPHPFCKESYKRRNVIERMFCRLKDARRIATRYDKCAITFLNALCLIAALTWWIN